MKSYVALLLPMLAVLPACGDKLDPGTPDASSSTTTSGSSSSDGTSSTTGNSNTTTGSSGGTGSTGTGLCGTSATTITYNGQAALVINNRCCVCHSSTTRGQSPDMSNYANAKGGIGTGGGVSQIKSGSMPPAGATALSTNESCIIETWASQGYAN